MKKNLSLTLLALLLSSITVMAQEEDDLLNMLDDADSNRITYTSATFKGTRLMNLPTIEVMGKNTLEFRIAHRFGDALTENAGAQTILGLDGPVALELSFDYSLSDRLSLGISRTNIQKVISGNVKYRLLRQSTKNEIPVSVTYFGKANITHEKNRDRLYDAFENRMSYVNHLIVARKFNSKLSLQLDVVHVHRNLVPLRADKNSMFALAASGRMKLTQRLALTGEYVYRLGSYSPNQSNFFDHLGIGVDIETGGHVFQLFVMNSFGINETQFIPNNDRDVSNGAVRFGFNVSRVFSL
ncbi:MAG: DUF5777 family beta-barrel protein [Bacteroidota bacterium]|nr:DUF5777 family beta-barrel protein [Bacteroidota bacterium]MDX5431016.1 DUF5777 family beta-barrel protein [Bacteroidota bacterium]MDX5469767.1 DUF5777 family beta-barrel protein [Bacteroidota bacterium]